MLCPIWANSQQAAEPDTIFLDAGWKVTQHRELAKYFRHIYKGGQDSTIIVHDFYLSNGNIQMIGTYHQEMKPANQNGRFQYFYPTGTLKAMYDYKWGIIHGELKRYYRNGQLKSVEQFDMGTKVDTTWLYYDNGQLHKLLIENLDYSSTNPSNKFSKQFLIESYSRTGEKQVEDGSGTDKEYFLSGKVKTSIEYANGLPHGKWIKYSGRKKKKSCVMTFKHGTFIKGEMFENGHKDVFSSLQRKAYFPTGDQGLEKFIHQHIGNCTNGFENEVIVLLTISTTGKVKLEQIISGNVNACQHEEINVLISNMPLWVPAVFDGEYVEGNASITIDFSK